MSDYDVVVVGGGPAGLVSGRELSKRGLNVLLLELQAQIGQDKTSTWIPNGFLDKRFSKAVKCSVESVEVNSMHREMNMEGDFGKIIDRAAFDRILAKEAVKEGLEIWVGSPVKDFLRKNGAINGVKTEAGDWSEDIESEAVIDASGSSAAWSSLFLRKILGLDWDKQELNQVNEYLMANTTTNEKVSIYYNSILAPMGCAWIYPGEEGFATAGIRGVRIHPDSALDEFLGREDPNPLRKSVPIGAYRGQIPMDVPLESTVSGSVLAVGSSAGQIYPFSGQGIKYALEAGKLAGRVLGEGFEEKDVSESKLSRYDDFWRSRFEKEIEVGKILQNSLSVSSDKKIDSLLEILIENPNLQKNFLDIFLARNLGKSLEGFFKDKECRKIFGKENVDKVLSII